MKLDAPHRVLPVPGHGARLPGLRAHLPARPRLRPLHRPAAVPALLPAHRVDAARVHLPAHRLVPRPAAVVVAAAAPSMDRLATAPSRKGSRR